MSNATFLIPGDNTFVTTFEDGSTESTPHVDVYTNKSKLKKFVKKVREEINRLVDPEVIPTDYEAAAVVNKQVNQTRKTFKHSNNKLNVIELVQDIATWKLDPNYVLAPHLMEFIPLLLECYEFFEYLLSLEENKKAKYLLRPLKNGFVRIINAYMIPSLEKVENDPNCGFE